MAYVENATPQVIENSLSISDSDGTQITSATITVSAGFIAGEDVLSFTNTASISGSYNASTGVLTLTGSDTLANYEAALESIRYSNNSDNPNTANRTISWVINDGSDDSATQTSTITVSPVDDDAPIISNTNTLDYTEADGSQIIDSSLILNDVDDTHIESATIIISSGFVSS